MSNCNGHVHPEEGGIPTPGQTQSSAVNAKYMKCIEEPYTYQTQVAGKAVSLQLCMH